MFESEFATILTDPPRRLESLPGLSVRATIPKSLLFLPLLFFALFLLMPLSILSADPAMRLALFPAEAAAGHVTKVSNGSACRGSASHRVQYVFTADGRDYRGALIACEDSPNYAAAEGDTVEVRYLKRDPATNLLRNARAQDPPIFLFLVMPFFFLLIFAAIYWPSVREVLRAKRVFVKGRISRGEVVFIKKRTAPYWAGMSSAGAAEVFVRIPAAQGKREVVAMCRNDWLMNQLAVGSTVHVAHWDDSSREVALLDAYLR